MPHGIEHTTDPKPLPATVLFFAGDRPLFSIVGILDRRHSRSSAFSIVGILDRRHSGSSARNAVARNREERK
jgi:hypothetical protein